MDKHIRALAWRFRHLFPIADIVEVSVFDDYFQRIKTLEPGPELAAFGEFWSQRAEAQLALWPSPGLRSPYKIDIRRFDPRQDRHTTTRWLYDPTGLARLVEIWPPLSSASLYSLPDPAGFNKLLGIEPVTDGRGAAA